MESQEKGDGLPSQHQLLARSSPGEQGQEEEEGGAVLEADQQQHAQSQAHAEERSADNLRRSMTS
ncbi:hypothetical protein KTAU_13330 [Thermogemmatispora aurantia]|uniref:Uncharacterized protein n=1 Tax=Thermogemmatispora aurantia TaxID=2045279 RepID=A0A5J4K983_9CHLR|nr:hypothetical protein KTAU_13330 [Thermogemmatispora aurantia]